jgi:hypothetical protein
MLGLVAFCKTAGGKGLHVVTPLAKLRKGQKLGWAEAKQFARDVRIDGRRFSQSFPREQVEGETARKDIPRLSKERSVFDGGRATFTARTCACTSIHAPELGTGEERARSAPLHHSHGANTPEKIQGLGRLLR